mmetsp:Transcript_19904/g.28510  ORF Transcript_19904/g.28510 Transcript_19904/m.28510 type:complete len:246 (+) Transcript_19904:458-1195(+)
MQKFHQSFNVIYETYMREKVFISPACTQGIGNFNPTIITSIAAKHLYHLNSNTKTVIHEMVSKSYLKELSTHPYLSIQLRMNDKKYEMSPETWNYITNISNIVSEVMPYFKKLNLTRLYLATDNCSAAREIFRMLQPLKVLTYSPCLNSLGEICLLAPLRGGQQLQDNTTDSAMPTYRLFMDIELLRKSRMFFGLFDSNLVRMVHRLRMPNWQMSRALATVTYTDSRKDLNSRLDDLQLELFIGE